LSVTRELWEERFLCELLTESPYDAVEEVLKERKMILRGLNLRNSLMLAVPFGLWLLVLCGLSAQAPLQTEHAPSGWFLAGNHPTNYRTGVDRSDLHGGLPSAYLASLAKGNGFGTLMQSISAANYVGKRIRLRGWVKSQDVGDWAGLWMRVDKGREAVAFDNMQDRAIKGAQPWTSYDVVLDVPSDATSINFGILLSGTGEVWLNDLSLEVVEVGTPTTGTNSGATLPQRPVNLGFNE
jgi:hypothetical protein